MLPLIPMYYYDRIDSESETAFTTLVYEFVRLSSGHSSCTCSICTLLVVLYMRLSLASESKQFACSHGKPLSRLRTFTAALEGGHMMSLLTQMPRSYADHALEYQKHVNIFPRRLYKPAATPSP